MKDKFTKRNIKDNKDYELFANLEENRIPTIFEDFIDGKLSKEVETKLYKDVGKSSFKKALIEAIANVLIVAQKYCSQAQVLKLKFADKTYTERPKSRLPKIEFFKQLANIVCDENIKGVLKNCICAHLVFDAVFADKDIGDEKIETEYVLKGIEENEKLSENDAYLLRVIFDEEEKQKYIKLVEEEAKKATKVEEKVEIPVEKKTKKTTKKKTKVEEKAETPKTETPKKKTEKTEEKTEEKEKESTVEIESKETLKVESEPIKEETKTVEKEVENNEEKETVESESEELKNTKNQYEELLEKYNKLAQENEELKAQSKKEIPEENDEEVDELHEKIIEAVTPENEDKLEAANDGPFLTVDQVIDDMDSAIRIGYIPGNGIKRMADKNRTWTVSVDPFISTIPDVNYIVKDDIEYYTNYKFGPFIQNFLFFIDRSIYEDLDPNFDSLTEDEQYSLIYDRYCRKNVTFRISTSEMKDGTINFKANSLETHKYNDFSNSVYVPVINNYSTKKIRDIILKEEKKEIEIPYFPVTLFSKINYIIIDRVLYKVNLMPKVSAYNSTCIWYSLDNTMVKLGEITLESNENYFYIYEDDVEMLLIKNEYITRLEIAYENTVEGSKEKTSSNSKPITIISEDEFINKISSYAKKNKLCYNYDDIKNFHISIKTSNLVILAGPSGLGKSRLPELYASAMDINEDKGQLLFVPVNPSFTEPSDLLGYVKPYIYNDKKDCNAPKEQQANINKDKINLNKDKINLNKDKTTPISEKTDKNDEEPVETKPKDTNYDGIFEESSTQIVSFLQNAHNNKTKLYMVIFDEMNLSQIEYWFAPFMSVLERETELRNIQLYSKEMNIENSDMYPPTINIGDNVIFIGTINMDETTKDISDRLLDRALVINLHKKTFKDYLAEENEAEELTDTNYKVPSSLFATFKKNTPNYIKVFTDREIEFLDALHDLIAGYLPQKGVSYRNVKMIANYIANSENIFDRDIAFDLAIKQTVIRKINGNENEIGKLIYQDSENNIQHFLEQYSDISEFKETLLAIKQKAQELDTYGFTR